MIDPTDAKETKGIKLKCTRVTDGFHILVVGGEEMMSGSFIIGGWIGSSPMNLWPRLSL